MCAKVRTFRGSPAGGSGVLLLLLATALAAVSGALPNDTVPEASTGARDARFLAFGEGLGSEEFSLYPAHWTEGYGADRDGDDGSELVRLVEGGSDLSPDPYERIPVRPYGWFGSTTIRYKDDGGYQQLSGADIARTPFDAAIFDASTGGELATDSHYPTAAALQSQGENTAPAPRTQQTNR
uniref:Uncharacterized protein n=1 Tax=Anopheles dirus TaxID=7168 RepID=A0A182NVY1_9DIPT